MELTADYPDYTQELVANISKLCSFLKSMQNSNSNVADLSVCEQLLKDAEPESATVLTVFYVIVLIAALIGNNNVMRTSASL